jgi:hypothetical protein
MANPSKTPRTIETTADESKHPDQLASEQIAGASEPEVNEKSYPKEFPEIIGDGIAACMRDRTAHQRVEREMDDWTRKLPANKEKRIEKLQEARLQMDTAKLALEAFYTRFRQLASTAKN